MDITSSTRIAFLDVAKALAIVLVVWGHLIQLTTINYWNNAVFSFIYSFHMPLFFLLSGMFVDKLFPLSFFEALRKRAFQLLLPALVLSFSIYLVEILLGERGITLRNVINVVERIPWFCATLFLCNMVVYIAKRWLKKDIWACLCSIVLLCLIPNIDCFNLKSFLPFVWCGYFVMKYKVVIFHNAVKILPISLLMFAFLLFFWDINYTVYKTEAIFWSINLSQGLVVYNGYNVLAFIYRLLIGFCGAMSVLLLTKILYGKIRWTKSSLIAYIGCNTLGIYLLQTLGEWYLFSHLSVVNELFNYPFLHTFSWMVQAVVLPICAIGIVLIITGLIYLLRKNDYLSLLFLGDIKVLSWKSSRPR